MAGDGDQPLDAHVVLLILHLSQILSKTVRKHVAEQLFQHAIARRVSFSLENEFLIPCCVIPESEDFVGVVERNGAEESLDISHHDLGLEPLAADGLIPEESINGDGCTNFDSFRRFHRAPDPVDKLNEVRRGRRHL